MAKYEGRDGLLYHYTDGAALMGVLSSAQMLTKYAVTDDVASRRIHGTVLWASDPTFLNDARELSVAAERVAAFLRDPKTLENPRFGQRVRELPFDTNWGVSWPAYVVASGVSEFRAGEPHVFVTCFCEEGDLLSQWKSYGRGGYAIGLDPGLLTGGGGNQGGGVLRDDGQLVVEQGVWFNPMIRKPGGGGGGTLFEWDPPQLVQVAYEEGEIDNLLDSFQPFLPSSRGNFSSDAFAVSKTLQLMASIKDSGFKEEREWRLVFVRPNALEGCEVRHRESSGVPVPYIHLHVPPAAIERIVIGPSSGQDASLREIAVRRLLEECGLECDVLESNVPYRG